MRVATHGRLLQPGAFGQSWAASHIGARGMRNSARKVRDQHITCGGSMRKRGFQVAGLKATALQVNYA
jgi:hypothetical protein